MGCVKEVVVVAVSRRRTLLLSPRYCAGVPNAGCSRRHSVETHASHTDRHDALTVLLYRAYERQDEGQR